MHPLLSSSDFPQSSPLIFRQIALRTSAPVRRWGLLALAVSSVAEGSLVVGYDQRYASGDYRAGVWSDSAGTADATASNGAAFTTVLTPSGAAAVANATDGAVLNFVRSSALGSGGTATVQAVIRIDGSDDDRKGPYALDQTSGWGGLYAGANRNGSNGIRGGNVGNTGGSGTVLNVSGGEPVPAGTWGVYTLVIDGSQSASPQMTASFHRLSDLATVFTVTESNENGATGNTLGLSNSGVLFGGERGGAASDTAGWEGAIADVIVYDSALSVAEVNTNLVELQSLYQFEGATASTITSGLLSYWAFEDDLVDSAHGVSGTASAANDEGSWVGGTACDEGRVGRGITLTGVEHVSVFDSVDLDRTGSDLTISAWMRVDQWDTQWQALMAKGESSAFRLARRSGDADELTYAGGASDIAGGAVNDGAWHHVVATTEDGGGVSLWIDGVNVASGGGPASLDNDGNSSAGPFLIGANPQAATLRNWVGAIDEVALWNRVLSTAEIAHLAEGNALLIDPFLSAVSSVQLSGTPFNGGAVQRSVTISNFGGSETLTISGVTLSGADASRFTIDSFPTILLPGEEGEVLLTFTPLAIESYEATLNLASNSEGSPNTSIDLAIDALPDLVDGITFRVYQADRSLTEMPILGYDQSPNVDELRTSINYKDGDKDGVADAGSVGGFGTVPPLERLEHLYAEAVGFLRISNSGSYAFRLTADDGAELDLNEALVLDHSEFERASEEALGSGPVALDEGIISFEVRFWSGSGAPCLKLEWMPPGSSTWEEIPSYAAGIEDDGLVTENATRVVSAGDKLVYYPGQSSGQLAQVHPGYDLFTFAGDYDKAYPGEGRPSPTSLTISGTSTTFRPQVGAMDFLPDGRLLVASFQPPAHGSAVPVDGELDHKIYAVSNALGDDLNAMVIEEVANGLSRPSGMCVVGADVYVCEIHKIVRLRDNNADGDFLDAGEEVDIVGSGDAWNTTNYHQFTFGLVHEAGYLYGTLSTSIVFGSAGLGLNGYNSENRGTWFRVEVATGEVEFLAGGLRTPNGIGFGPEGKLFGTDNQGSWNPANSLYEFTENHFYGHYVQWFEDSATDPVRNPNGEQATGFANPDRQPSTFWDSALYWESGETPAYASMYEGGKRRFTRPAVYLPQSEISQSPTEPLIIGDQHPIFKGQMYVGELTMGGVRRVFLEKVNGRYQGAAFRFTQGMVAGNNRMVWGPDGALYVGGMGPGDNSNWSWRGTWYGLQRLKPNGAEAFEIQSVRAIGDGFLVTFTKPVHATVLGNLANYEGVENWTYDEQSYTYGAGQRDLAELTVSSAEPLEGGRSVRLTIPGLTAESVVHLQMADTLLSAEGEPLWSGEAFYTLNAIPNAFEEAWAEWLTKYFPGVADLALVGITADPDGDGRDNFSELIAGGDPLAADQIESVSMMAAGEDFELATREQIGLSPSVKSYWESSVDLVSWSEVTDGITILEVTALANGFSQVRYRFSPSSDTPVLFLRRVSELVE